jgi:hypothetical protein
VSDDLRQDGTEAWSPSPARGYSWPPFEPGNTASVRHGAGSRRILSPIAERFAEQAVEVAPWLDRPAFRSALAAWAWAEAVCSRYRAWFDERDVLDPETDKPSPNVQRWHEWERKALTARERLGLDPSSLSLLMARLAEATKTALPLLADGRDLDGLDQLAAEGRRVLEEATRRGALDPGDGESALRGTSRAELRRRAGIDDDEHEPAGLPPAYGDDQGGRRGD